MMFIAKKDKKGKIERSNMMNNCCFLIDQCYKLNKLLINLCKGQIITNYILCD
ncbi:hypothetical protein M153_2350009738 [Pseudoloma neurophilia]|uniref:Uncharacterized protein n=1 Tax=Pseudoloma neurophilia TaxID=146866 RepID=A0A0R0LZ26_9MICR|nr:hypothetical protein M153_2350009738 [Pseudoloma neurophilia]